VKIGAVAVLELRVISFFTERGRESECSGRAWERERVRERERERGARVLVKKKKTKKMEKTDVILHIYDVTNSGSDKTNNTILHINKIFKDGIGIGGIFHSAVQVSPSLSIYVSLNLCIAWLPYYMVL
jgi:hypothetical protein